MIINMTLFLFYQTTRPGTFFLSFFLYTCLHCAVVMSLQTTPKHIVVVGGGIQGRCKHNVVVDGGIQGASHVF